MKTQTMVAIGVGLGVVAIVGITLARKASPTKEECLKAASLVRPTEDEVRAFIRAKGADARVLPRLPKPDKSVYDVYSMADGAFFYLGWTSEPMRWEVNDDRNIEFYRWLLGMRCGA